MKYLFLGGNFHVVFGIFNSILVIHRDPEWPRSWVDSGQYLLPPNCRLPQLRGDVLVDRKRFCTELVFEVIQKTLMQAQCMAYAMAVPEIRVVIKRLN